MAARADEAGGGRAWSRPASRGDLRLEALLRAAEELLEEKPFSEVSVGEIAGRAGISRPTFYFYFDTKHALLAAVLERVTQDKLQLALRGLAPEAPDDDPARTFRESYHEILRLWREHAAVVLAASDAMRSDPVLERVYADMNEAFVVSATAWIERERATGRAPAGVDARTLATTLVWMSERNLYSILLGPQDEAQEELRIEALAQVWIRSTYGADTPLVP
ncbi:HTH-type transcriptional regulator EthR [Kineosporia sp. NBRC 101677]|uniref:TetR/AcrR family transcriptional regulator n=1 Tax=Kineosporia sp. NBRC 101677 TaxID=3032197 RepID=UPI0024A420BB|nr:TetR/AcrR family transcriptional regulator [Kineosporia sp. NBRC 101677]GLY16889.1 HTH-type transcriptional regulator EthR [Kineosporia sp. NBRC 101677]